MTDTGGTERPLDAEEIDLVWQTYLSFGGHEGRAQVAAYLGGHTAVPDEDADQLQAALHECQLDVVSPVRFGGEDQSRALSLQVEAIVALLDDDQQPAPAPVGQPVSLADHPLALRTGRSTEAQVLTPGSMPSAGAVVRIGGVPSSGWEVHPSGDEVLVLLSGAAQVALEADPHHPALLDEAYACSIVPRGMRHLHLATESDTKVLYITPGADLNTSALT